MKKFSIIVVLISCIAIVFLTCLIANVYVDASKIGGISKREELRHQIRFLILLNAIVFGVGFLLRKLYLLERELHQARLERIEETNRILALLEQKRNDDDTLPPSSDASSTTSPPMT